MTTIRIAPSGTVRGLWTDEINWQSLERLPSSGLRTSSFAATPAMVRP